MLIPLLAETTLPPYVDEIVVILIKVFGAVLVALAALAVRKLGKKWGLESTEAGERRARMLAQDGINFAERWARNRDLDRDEKTPGEDKIEAALDFVIEVDKAIGVSAKARAAFAKRIEAELERSEGGDEDS